MDFGLESTWSWPASGRVQARTTAVRTISSSAVSGVKQMLFSSSALRLNQGLARPEPHEDRIHAGEVGVADDKLLA